jgi:anaerobic selenocysteine-containing dehydrogenase
MFTTSIVSARPCRSQTNAQLAAGCIHVICRGCAGHEEAKVPGEVGFACPFCSSKCAIAADKLLVDVGTVAQLKLQQQHLGSGRAAAVPDCDVCGDDPATK